MSAPTAFRRNVAVVIGIDGYPAGIPALRSAVNDARRLGRLLEADHGFTVISLVDAEASQQAIHDLLTRRLPAELTADDRVVFYYAGHGVAVDGDDGPNGFILPQDARLGEPATYLAMAHLHDALDALPCRHMLVILDSCFAGAFRWSSTRDLVRAPAVIHQERYDRFVHDSAWQVLTSAAYDQTAADQLLTGSLGSRGDGVHSPFALALFDALAGAADLAPAGGDGIITATELYLYLEERLQVETIAQRRRQTPGLWPLRKQDKGEFVFLVPGRDLDLPPAPPLTYDNNPYRGLASYERDHADVFFGRDAVVSDLAAFVSARALTVVLGASGTGKSSVVKAGLLPRLEADGDWTALPVVRPGATPIHALAQAVFSAGDQAAPVDADRIREAVGRRLENETARLILVVDQFEELVTLTRSPSERVAFLDLLADLAESAAGRLRIVLTMRTDFEAQFDRSRLSGWWQSGRFIVPPPTRRDYKEAIEGPASRRVLYFEPASLVETLLDEVTAMPGGLPLLSFTLSELYRRYVERQGDNRALTRADYDALGGVAGALRSRADAELAALDGPHQATLRRLMLRMLVLENGTLARQRVTRGELDHWDPAESARITAVLARFTRARLLVEGVAADGTAYVEPAHDALVTSWGRLLEWTHDAQAREPDLHFLHALARTAQDWLRAGRGDRPGLLWRDKVRSSRLWALRKTDRVQFNLIEDLFCKASVARRRFIRNGVAALVTAIALAGVTATLLGLVAERQRNEAVAQRNEAIKQTRTAWSSALATKAATAIDSLRDRASGMKLAAAAFEADPTNTAAALLVQKAFYGDGLFEYRGGWYAAPFHIHPVFGDEQHRQAAYGSSAAWSPDSRRMLVVLRDETATTDVRILGVDGTTRGGFTLTEEVLTTDRSPMLVFSADGQFVIAPSSAAAWDLNGDRVSASFAAALVPASSGLHEGAWENSQPLIPVAYRTAVTPDRRAWAGQALEKWVIARGGWNVPFDEVSMTYQSFPGGRFAVMRDGLLVSVVPGDWSEAALTRDGRYLATGNAAGDVTLWRIDDDTAPVNDGTLEATRLADLWHGAGRIQSLEFSPDESRLYAIGLDEGLRVWHLTSNPLTVTPADPKATIARPPLVSADGHVVAAVSSRGDYDFTLNVSDAASGMQWTRNYGTMDSTVAVLHDGMVAASDRRTLWLIDRRGVEQFGIPLDEARIVGVSADRRAVLLESYEQWPGVLALPIVPGDLIAMARSAGHLTMTQAEIARLDVGPILSGLAALADQNEQAEPLIDLLTASIRRLLFGAGVGAGVESRDASPPAPPVVLPPTWRALADALAAPSAADNPDGWSPASRLIYHVLETGAVNAVLKTGAPPPFLDGPHVDGEWNRFSETFGRYNPAFVTWVATTLIPESREAPLRQATQAIYDRRIRQTARTYALALDALEAAPGLRSAVAARYGALTTGRGDYLLESLAPIAPAIGLRPEGDPQDFIVAAGFWIRRDLDGTAPDFARGLRALLDVYDPDFNPVGPQPR